MRLTKSSIKDLPVPATGQAFFRDDVLRPLAVRVTAGGTKSFVVEKILKRQASRKPRVLRKTIGRCNEMSVEAARRKPSSCSPISPEALILWQTKGERGPRRSR